NYTTTEFLPAWQVDTEGDYRITVETDLDDEVPSNDRKDSVVYMYNTSDVGTLSINYPTPIALEGQITVNATVYNFGTLDQSTVPVNCSIYTASEVEIFSDDMESGIGGWTHYNNSGPDLWHLTDSHYQSYNHSWFCGYEPWGYADNMENVLESPWIDLSTAQYPTLHFSLYVDLESCCDFLHLYVCSNASGCTLMGTWAGTTEWNEVNVALQQYVGDIIQLQFVMDTDSSVTYDGVCIDDINITGYTPGSLLFSDDVSVNLAAGQSRDVEFAPWTAVPGCYFVNVSTQLAGDEDSSNNATQQVTHILPGVVNVDDDFDSSTPGWGTYNFSSIQTALYNVMPYGTVNVFNGFYNESVRID
ncbi:MAG: hypothetical protein ACP5FL_07450, partial [Thermoplasmatota archaeon]